jgi:hypothetical protein
MNSRRSLVALLLAAFPSFAFAQLISAPCEVDVAPPGYAIYPASPLTYPMTSDRYAVQYRLGGGDWTDAQIHMSVYGGTNSSPWLS